MLRRKNRRKFVVANKKRFITILSVFVLVVVFVTIGTMKLMNHKKSDEALAVQVQSSKEKEDKNESIKKKVPKEDLDNTVEPNKEKDKKVQVIKTDDKEIKNTKEVVDSRQTIQENTQDQNTDISHKMYFKDSLFLGDSITEVLSVYEILDDDSVYGVKGFTVVKAKKQINAIIQTNPKKMFILFGMNDLGYGMSEEQFVKDYAELIDLIQEKLPKTEIYVQSLLPVTEKVEQSRPNLSNARVNAFNQALSIMLKEKHIHFMDITSIVSSDLYEQDGIHFKPKFYKVWLDFIREALEHQ
jgi:hypothetical protein